MRTTMPVPIVVACLAAAGCASPPPVAQAVSPQHLHRVAFAAAREGPASADLENARRKLALAGRLDARAEADAIRWLAEQAEVDLQLAAVKVRLGTPR